MRAKFTILFSLLIVMVVVAACSGNDGTPPPAPYGIDTRSAPTAEDMDTLIPETVGAFTTLDRNGDPSAEPAVYGGMYHSDDGTVQISVWVYADAAAAKSGLKDIYNGSFKDTSAIKSLTTDPAFVKLVSDTAYDVNWTHGNYLFLLDANSEAAMDAFMASYPY